MLLAATSIPTTTALPTWLVVVLSILAVLGPVLAALVSGSAGIYGALRGARSATQTAERNATLARQDEQRRWNRERREKAYIALLDRRNRQVEINRRWHDFREDTSEDEADELIRDSRHAERSLRVAFAAIELVGSTEAVELSRRWVRELPSAHVVEGEPAIRDQFVALIRKELGVDD